MSSNQIVRFIYQGQFLKDTNTVKSYNIRDQTTIHCHITSKQPTANNSSIATATTTTTSNTSNTNNPINYPTNSVNSIQQEPTTNTNNTENNNNNNGNTTRIISIEFSSVLLPIFTILLASIWYFRMNFKQFFTPLTNLFLLFMTFIYTIFLFIHFYQMFTFTHRLTTRARRAAAN